MIFIQAMKAYGIIGPMKTHNDTSCYCKELSIFSQCVILFPLIHNFTQDQSTRANEFISVLFSKNINISLHG